MSKRKAAREEASSTKQSRNPNWTVDEEKELVLAVDSNYDTLFGAHSNKVTEQVKSGIWLQIKEKVTYFYRQ
jgi:hypothetical protein